MPYGSIKEYKAAGWEGLVETITSGITALHGLKYGIIDTRDEVTVVQVYPGALLNDHNLVVLRTVDIEREHLRRDRYRR